MAGTDIQSDRPSDTSRIAGIALIVLSTVFFALAGIFTKSNSADAWTVACWRGLIGAVAIGFYVRMRSNRRRPGPGYKLGWRGWALVVVGAVSSLFFIASFKYTYVANVAVIYATVPFMAAGIEWVALRQPARLQTMLTALVSLIGVAIIVAGSIGGGQLFGDALAVVMTFGCAVYLVMVRTYSDTPVVWAAAVSSLLLFVAGWAVTDPLDISSRDFLVIATFGLTFAAASILWTEGARLLPPSESGLLGGAEVPLAILFAWLILAEAPPLQSIIGGGIVLVAVFAHASRDLLVNRPSVPTGPDATHQPVEALSEYDR